MDTRLFIFLSIVFGVDVGIWIVKELMIQEADEKLPDNEKIRRSMWARNGLKFGEMSRMWDVHSQCYPRSSLRFWYVGLWVVLFSCLFFRMSVLLK